MSRLIDADALINDILTDYGCDPKYIADETIDGLKPYTDQLILERIGLQPTIAASPWHRVKDELPKFGEYVLAWEIQGFAVVDKYVGIGDGRWGLENDGAIYTHWMPLPEPPKEDV